MTLEDNPEAPVVADAEGINRRGSAGAGRLFGVPRDRRPGQSVDLGAPGTLRTRRWAGDRRTTGTGAARYGAGDLLAVPARQGNGRGAQ